MKKTSKWLAVLLACAMMGGTLSGCSILNPKAEDKKNETNSTASSAGDTGEVPELASSYPEFTKRHSQKITFFEQGWTGPEKDLDFVTPEVARLTNFEIVYEPMTVPTGDDYRQKLNLIVAGDNVPDIFFGGNDDYTRTIYQKLGEKGKIWDLTEIIKDYPNLYELVKPELNLFAKDGKNYFVPTQTGRGNELLYEAPHGLGIREDFLKQLNMECPKTTDELYTYLKRCKEEIKQVNGQDIIGIVLGEGLAGLEHFYEPFFPVVGVQGAYELPFDPGDNFKVKNYLFSDSPELMAASKFINKLSREGMFDREALTIKSAQVGEKVSSGRVAAEVAPWWDMNAFSDNAKQDVPDLMYAVVPKIYNSDEIRASREVKWTNWVGSWSSLIVSKNIDEETLRHFLAMLDWMTTKDGQMLVHAGIEGKSYEFNDQGKYIYTEQFLKDTNDMDWNKAASYGVGYYAQMVFNMPVFTDLRDTPPSLLRADNKKGWDNQQRHRDLYDADMKPTKDYYFIPGPIESQKFTPIIDARYEFFAKVIDAKSEADVEKLVTEWGKTCKSMGIDEIVAERQAYIDNFVLPE